MAQFRQEFFRTLEQMLKVSSDPLLQDRLPLSDPANLSARVLRHGLAVSAFSMLEKYISSVFEYLLWQDVSKSNLKFTDFPDKMREFIVVDSVLGITNKLSFIKNSSDRISHVDQSMTLMVQYKSTPPMYTSFGFSPKGSNVGHEDIKQAFGIFEVKDAWRQMNVIASSIGGAVISLKENFISLSSARHRAAHDPVSSIPVSDLQTNIRSAIVIGICCDILAKNAGIAIQSCKNKKNLAKNVAKFRRACRFLDEQPSGYWLERGSSNIRGVKLYSSREDGIKGVNGRSGNPYVVVRDLTGQPIELAG